MENTTVLILAGGKGTRLMSVVSDRPKPMALIQNVPFLHCLIDRMSQLGFKKICLLTGYMHEFIEGYFNSHSIGKVEITYSREETPLGTAGALRKAMGVAPSEKYVALNGDTYFGFSESCIANCLEKINQSPYSFVIGLKKMISPERYGVVDWEMDSGVVKGFLEKGKVSGEAFINSGVYAFTKDIFNDLRNEDFSLENEVFPRFVEKKRLIGFPMDGEFIDIGIPEDYQRAQAIVPLPKRSKLGNKK